MLISIASQVFAIFVMLGILTAIIIVHECGHFSVARFFGFQTPVFGFGLPFGPSWTIGTRWGTEFRVHACLLGGYVAIPELGDESNQEEAFGVPLKPFRKFPIWQRALVAFAGVGFNIIFAYIVMFGMYASLGEPTQPTVIYSLIKSNPIATDAGIKINDQLVAINEHKVKSPDEAVHLLVAHKLEPVKIEILRNGQPITFNVTTNKDGRVGMGLVSKGPVSYQKMEGNIFEIAWAALVRLWTLTYSMVEALGQMVSGIFSGGGGGAADPGHKFGLQDLHGVLAVIKIGADIAQQDWSQLFIFTIMISMDLAIINLLPWPALDGGHLAFMAVEAVRGRPMGEKSQGELVKWGFISLIVLMAVVMVNDITALVTGKLDMKKKKEERQERPAPDETPAPTTPGN